MMHFSEISNFNGFQRWLLGTKMSFYGMDMSPPWWFGVSSWHYALYGVIMLLVEPSWVETSLFPYRAFALWLIFVQSPASYKADYLDLTQDSNFHVIDRIMATPGALLEASRTAVYMMNGVATTTIVATLLVNVMVVHCFIQSNKAQARKDCDGFLRWHYLWHVGPLLTSCIVVVDYYWFSHPQQHTSSIEPTYLLFNASLSESSVTLAASY